MGLENKYYSLGIWYKNIGQVPLFHRNLFHTVLNLFIGLAFHTCLTCICYNILGMHFNSFMPIIGGKFI